MTDCLDYPEVYIISFPLIHGMTDILTLSHILYNRLTFFDCSGTSTSNIPFTCYDSEYEMQKFADAQTSPDANDTAALGQLWARGTIDANTCAQKHNVTGTLIGTAFTARDVMSIADSVGEDGLLRYWGKNVSKRVKESLLIQSRFFIWYYLGSHASRHVSGQG